MSFLKKNLLQEQKDDAKIGKQIMAQMKRGFKKNETGGHFYQKGEGANMISSSRIIHQLQLMLFSKIRDRIQLFRDQVTMN